MSQMARAVLNAFAAETDRISRSAQAITTTSIPSEYGVVPLEATPSPRGVIDATNIITDPVFAGSTGNWATSGATLDTVPISDLPRYSSAARATTTTNGTASILYVSFVAPITASFYWYAYIKTTATGTTDSTYITEVADTSGAGVGTPTSLRPTAGGGWMRAGDLSKLTAGTTYRLRTRTTPAASVAGDQLYMTGATVCATMNPGEAFYGGMDYTDQNLYGWSGPANNSSSVRYSQSLDMLGMRENERRLSVAPPGLSFAQRQQYILGRIQARHQPYGSTFVNLLVDMVKTEDPSFTASRVRVIENFADYSVVVNVNYNPSGNLRNRLERLIQDAKPAHLKFNTNTDVIYGNFRAGISAAGDQL